VAKLQWTEALGRRTGLTGLQAALPDQSGVEEFINVGLSKEHASVEFDVGKTPLHQALDGPLADLKMRHEIILGQVFSVHA
jgi:hypothetical protein